MPKYKLKEDVHFLTGDFNDDGTREEFRLQGGTVFNFDLVEEEKSGCPYCNIDIPLEKDEGHVFFKKHLENCREEEKPWPQVTEHLDPNKDIASSAEYDMYVKQKLESITKPVGGNPWPQEGDKIFRIHFIADNREYIILPWNFSFSSENDIGLFDFRTKQEAEHAAEKIKELLASLKK